MKNKLLRLLIMTIKLSAYGLVLQIFCTGMLMGYDSNAQYKSASETYIDVWGGDKTVGEILKMIENTTDFSFYYVKGEINKKQKISLNISGLNSVADVLLKISEESKLKFRQVNNSISISPISNSELNKGIGRLEVEISSILITGKIISDTDPDGLPGVNVILKGTNIGTVTDVSGDYSLEIPDENSVLLFSSVGYLSEEIVVGSRIVINLSMTPDITALEEIVVVGYGSVKKKDLTGAVVSLGEEEMTTGAAITSAAGMLQGRAAGVEVSANDGEPGQNLNIVIRGNTSISNSNQPLYVVDGFPLAAGVSIAPEDIATIDILKDAASAAIYGSRASAGVVLITTKKGKSGRSEISLDGYAGIQTINGSVDYLDWTDVGRIANEQYAQGINDGNPLLSPADLGNGNNTDWIAETTREAKIQSYTLRASGGDDKSRFSLSGTYFDQEGIFLLNKFTRLSIRLNADRKFGDKTMVGMNAYVSRVKSNFLQKRPGSRGTSPLYRTLGASPGRAAYNDDGTLAQTAFSRDVRPWTNPIGLFTENTNDFSEWRTYSNLFIDHNILDNLVARINMGFDHTAGTQGIFSSGIYSPTAPDSFGSIRESKSTSFLMEGTLNYKLLSGDHGLDILAGASTQFDQFFGFSLRGTEFPTDKTLYNNLGSASNLGISSFRSDETLISYFARANYSFQGKYLLTATVRADGASKFGENEKWGTFPSVSAAWRISEEDFLSGSSWISDLKLRASYGVTGNNNFSPYTSLERVGTGKSFSFDGGSASKGLGTSGRFAPNPDLKWEVTKMLNIGLDFGFWNNRFYGSIEYYNSNTEDLIIDKPISAPSTGFTTIRSNVGSITNTGIELTLGGHIIDGDNFKWIANANWSTNDNEITAMAGDNPINLLVARQPYGEIGEHTFRQLIEGGRIGDFFGYTYRGVLQPGEVYTPQPNSTQAGSALYEDINNDGIIDSDDRSVIGNANPDFIWGFNNRFEFAGFYLDVFLQGVVGNDIFNFKAITADRTLSTKALERYSPENPTGTRPGINYFANEYGSYVNTEFIEDGSYVRLKNLSLGYNFNLDNVSWISNLNIYIQGQNLLTITDYTGFDPEISFNYNGSQSSVNRGVDDYGFPNYKTYTLGLKLTF